VLDGDFTRGEPELPSGIDVAIHSAATVSFDPPIHEAFQTNLLGAQNLYRAVARTTRRTSFTSRPRTSPASRRA
jgi:nucleoside-diphosphate-sugar epimerase